MHSYDITMKGAFNRLLDPTSIISCREKDKKLLNYLSPW